MDQAEWQRLLDVVGEIQGGFPDGIAFIGGIAVHAHTAADVATAPYAGMSHDADFMILLADFADLRDIEVLTPNRRLTRQQFSKGGFEFDVYVEGQHDLPVPADEAVAWSEMKARLRVACPEHLMILKLKAYEDRRGTGKGEKDEDDVIRLLLVSGNWRQECLSRLSDRMLSDLDEIVAGDAPPRLAGGNLHEAKAIRARARLNADLIRKAHVLNFGEDHAPRP